MCIIMDIVKDVSNTKIACFHIGYTIKNVTKEGEPIPAQLVVYSATVESLVAQNAFILPVYNPGNDIRKIIPINMKELPDFFDSVDRIFERWYPTPKKQSWLSTNSYSFDSESLPVYKVGDYKFSIMPHKSDFKNIDRNQLNINPAAKVSIDEHTDDYSFIVYQFNKSGKVDVTPFGYICPSYENETLFCPTIHGHPHSSVPNTSGLGYVANFHMDYASMNPSFDQAADFDHIIYSLAKSDPKIIASATNRISAEELSSFNRILKKINKDYHNRSIVIYIPKNIIPIKIEIKGKKPNRNMIINSSKRDFLQDLVIDSPSSSYLRNPPSHSGQSFIDVYGTNPVLQRNMMTNPAWSNDRPYMPRDIHAAVPGRSGPMQPAVMMAAPPVEMMAGPPVDM